MRKTLIIRLSALGDVALLVPVVRAVAKEYPQDRFTVLTRAPFVSLFEGLPPNVSTLAFEPKGKHKGVMGLFRLWRELRRSGFTDIADVHDVLRSKLLRVLLSVKGGKAHINKGRASKQAFIKTKKQPYPLKHTTVRYAEVFRALHLRVDLTSRSSVSFPNGGDESSVVSDDGDTAGGVSVGIAPFARHQTKTYPLDLMEKVIDLLHHHPKIHRILLFGGGGEELRQMKVWEDSFEKVDCQAGKWGLFDELQVIRSLDVLVSMDSANMHLASLVGTPVVSIWGATHPFLGFYGVGQSLHSAIQSEEVSCRPCSVFGGTPCIHVGADEYMCLKRVSPQQIVDRVLHVLRIWKGKDI